MRILLAAGITLFSFCTLFAQEIKMVCIKNACVQAEVVSSEADRERGLMFKQALPENQGMLFIFDRPQNPRFWMKNVNFPLDIIWIDQAKNVVDLKLNAQPCKSEPCETFLPRASSLYVLEVNAGFVRQYGIAVGDRVNF
jgi:uncharacterized protein